jgi:thiol:disulfide interchange protein DsbG
MLTAGIMATTTQAIAAPTGLLAHVLASHHAGKIIRTFPGPGGLTGIVMEYNGSKAIAYLTPDGKYLISGLVANLENGHNMTNGYGLKYIGKVDILKGPAASRIAFQCASLSGITVGNKTAKNYMIAVFNPSTPMGYKVMAAMMGEAGQMQKKGALNVMALKLVPIGPLAPAILSAGNRGREDRLLNVLHHQPAGATISLGSRFAARNNTVLSQIPMKTPFLVIYFPQANMEAAIPVHNLLRVGSAVGSAEVLANSVQNPAGAR